MQEEFVDSREQYITNEVDKKIVDFIKSYAFKDSKEVYTNGAILVPYFRVLDAIILKGEDYSSM